MYSVYKYIHCTYIYRNHNPNNDHIQIAKDVLSTNEIHSRQNFFNKFRNATKLIVNYIL